MQEIVTINTKIKSIIRFILNAEDIKNLKMGKTLHIFREETGESFSIRINPKDFPITENTKNEVANNTGLRENKDGIYNITLSLCELLGPIIQRIAGEFKSEFSKYNEFEIDLQI